MSKVKKEKESKIFYFAIVLLVLSFLLLAFSIYLTKKAVLDIKIVNASLEVGKENKIGVGFDSSGQLNFGIVPRGNYLDREIDLTNNYNKNIIVKTEVSGNISMFLNAESGFKIESGETKKVRISLNVPADSELGFYSGEVKFIFKVD